MSTFKRFDQKSRNVENVPCAREIDIKGEKKELSGAKQEKKGEKGGIDKYLYTRAQGTSATKRLNSMKSEAFLSQSGTKTEIVRDKTRETELTSGAKLPPNCSLITGVVVERCRYHPILFRRMIAGGTLSAETGCPVLDACELTKELTKELTSPRKE